MKEHKQGRRILKREVITNQSDPRMVEFRESYGEFEPGSKRKTVKLEITEYDSSPDKLNLTTKFGYYEGKPPIGYREFSRKLYQKVLNDSVDKKTSD